MTTLSDTRFPGNSGIDALRARSGWIVALGVVYAIAGLVALYSVALATVASVFVVGIAMVFAGAAEIINAFQIKSWGKFVLWLALGVLYIIAGILTFENPMFVAVILTLMLAAALIVSGIMRIVLAFSMKEGNSWFLVAVSGAITVLLGAIILMRWPFSSVYVLGLFLGIDLLFAGIGWIAVGLGLKARPARAATPAA